MSGVVWLEPDMNRRVQQAVENLVAAIRSANALPYPDRETANKARRTLHHAEDEFWIAAREEATGGRSEA